MHGPRNGRRGDGFVIDSHAQRDEPHPLSAAQLRRCGEAVHIEAAYRTFDHDTTVQLRRTLFPPHSKKGVPA